MEKRDGNEKKQSAPALEKGLDIIEALAEEPGGLSQKEIAHRVGRTVSEIFRMLNVLEQREYIARDQQTGLYTLTLLMFELAHRHPPTRRLLSAAISEMERLSSAIGHSCHLVAMHADKLMVIGQAQADHLLMGWLVRLGAVFPLSEKYTSARVFASFQLDGRREHFLSVMASSEQDSNVDKIRSQLDDIRIRGYDVSQSKVAIGVIDISFPILNHFGQAEAVLTVPYMGQPDNPKSEDFLVRETRRSAEAISVKIGGKP